MSTFKVDQVDFQTEQYVVQSAAAILCAHTVLCQIPMPFREDVYLSIHSQPELPQQTHRNRAEMSTQSSTSAG